jgi:competence protein ComEC
MKKYLAIFILVLFLAPLITSAHPGRTNKAGMHRCKTNCEKWGEEYGKYHQHKIHKNKIRNARVHARHYSRSL